MVTMAGCRISASSLEDIIDDHEPSFYTLKLKFSICMFIKLAGLNGNLVILTHDIPLCRQ
jgi:hypothetical protein